MTALQREAIAWALVALALFGGYVGWRHQVRADAIRDLQEHVADSTHQVAVQVQQKATQDAAGARQAASDSARKAMGLVQVARAQKAVADSAIKGAVNEAARATALLADSVATVAQLRAETGRLRDTVAALAASAQQALALDSVAIRALMVTHAADSTALQRGVVSENAAIARAVAAEAGWKAERSSRPGIGSTIRHFALGAGVGALAYAILKK